MYLKDIEPDEIDLTIGNKDACVLEVDDIEDLEIIAMLMEPSPPDGFHVVNTQTVPGLHDLEVIRNLQMFVQVYRAKLGLNQQASNFPKHFQRLIHTIYFKIRSMIPCAICDFRFRLDFPESVRHGSLRYFNVHLLKNSVFRYSRKKSKFSLRAWLSV